MTITTTTCSVEVVGNGAQTVFDYAFLIPQKAYATLELYDTDTDTTTPINAASWSMTGAGDEAGGTFTYPLVGSPISSTERLILKREVPTTQPYEFNNQGAYYPTQVGAALDWIVMVLQQVQRDRGVIVQLDGVEVGSFGTINFVGAGWTLTDAGNGTIDVEFTG